MRLDCPRCGRTLEYTDRRPSFCAYCGKPLPRPNELTAPHDPAEAPTLPRVDPRPLKCGTVPECIGGYRLVRPLGTGGMGTVYEAVELATRRRVALKLIAPEYAGSEETVARFRQEGRLASQVVHPRCVFVHKADEEAGLPYIVMELMPGETLQDLVQQRGPLPVEEAVTKILDVIDGLQEAHRLGIIHRDVKPSNCFLETDGRVKIGDFGLSRSLVNDARLTRTGAFLGTPLYASPEQIRADPVDQQSDVYSVAATLYFLLTGRAPHQTGDATATMARIVCEPAPPMRDTRPELSAKLDEVVLQGLERDRGRRWANLEDFRQALLPFVPQRLPAAGLAPRFAAFLVDHVLLQVAILVVYLLYAWVVTDSLLNFLDEEVTAPVEIPVALLWVGYFAILEGRWGASLGKWFFGLNVCTPAGGDPPGVLRALFRAAILHVFVHLAWYVGLLFPPIPPPEAGVIMFDWRGWVLTGFAVLGPFAPLVTMRRRNGLRGLHELLSGTRVIAREPREPGLVVPSRRLEQEVTRPAGAPERLGPYLILGVLAENDGEQVLLGQDPALGRKALLWLRAPGSPALPAGRQELARGSRLRWLSGGCHGGRPWDAFVAPAGCALHDLVLRHGRLSWADVRPLLQQLTDELLTAKTEGSLPNDPTTDFLWIQPDRRVCLLEFPLQELPARLHPRSQSAAAEPEMSLLRDTAMLTLEGRRPEAGPRTDGVRAPVPGFAAPVLRRLVQGEQGYAGLEEWRVALSATQDRAARVSPAIRLAHLELLFLVLLPGLINTLLTPTGIFLEQAKDPVRQTFAFQAMMSELETHAPAESALAIRTDPWAALIYSHLASQGLGLMDSLPSLMYEHHRLHEARMRSLSWPMRKLVWLNFPSEGEEITAAAWPVEYFDYTRTRGRSAQWKPAMVPGYDVATAFLLFFPAVWVLWAFLARGGFSFRLAGLSLVRSDGWPAARWQCGLRALLVWGPVVGLLCFSVWLDSWYVGRYLADEAPAWAPWLSWGSWWLGVLLLPAFALMALRRPERSLHDWLVGTYLVPR